MSEENETFIVRENPPTFPLGFRFGIAEEVCIIDFIDIPNKNVTKTFYSIAITKDLARELIENLNNFVNEQHS